LSSFSEVSQILPGNALKSKIALCFFIFQDSDHAWYLKKNLWKVDHHNWDWCKICLIYNFNISLMNNKMERAASPARLAYTSDKHPRHTLESINVLRKHRELCDVVLIVGIEYTFPSVGFVFTTLMVHTCM
jgi:hypothetical protein